MISRLISGVYMHFLRKLEQILGIGLQGKITGLFIGLTIFGLALNITSVITLMKQQGDAVIINIAGRQRMLSQKMSKEAILIDNNISGKGAYKELERTFRLFEKSHQGLIYGDEDLEIGPTTDDDILKQMEVVDRLWKPFREHIKSVLSSGSRTPEMKRSIDWVLIGYL